MGMTGHFFIFKNVEKLYYSFTINIQYFSSKYILEDKLDKLRNNYVINLIILNNCLIFVDL